jgi:hypothetical protein
VRKAVVLVLALCACESRYGSYFNIDGDANEIRFDHVRLFWGNDPQTRAFGTPSGAHAGTVYTREHDASDDYDVEHNADGSLATQTTYYLPVSEENRQLGYVGAVVYDRSTSDRPIGVGEWRDFSLEAGVVAKYDIELQKAPANVIDKLELWGNDPGCFAWQHERDGQFSTIAVLSPDDADCDGLVTSADCNDTCPTGAMTCNPDAGFCSSGTTCGLGCAKGGMCAISTCGPPTACSDTCAKHLAFDQRMKCASDATPDHLQIDVFMNGGTPCARSFLVMPYQLPCVHPKAEWIEQLNDNWSFSVAPGSNADVLITMDALSTTQSFSNDHHLLISCDPKAGELARWSFFIGVQPGTSNCGPLPNYMLRDSALGSAFFCP